MAQQIYKDKKEELSNQIKLEISTIISTAEYMLWIYPIKPLSYDGQQLCFSAPSDHAATTLTTNYTDLFLKVIGDLNLPVERILFISEKEAEKLLSVAPPTETETLSSEKKNPFVSKYTFENYVVGSSNRMAVVTAHTVAENPGLNDGLLSLNPFYIYGGVGLGKTHLLHAIGNYLFEHRPELNVIYVSADRLSNEYFSSLNKYNSDKDSYRNFYHKYAECDVLMVDDVQFLQKKGGLQEVFFHIFNDLYQNGKQIILSSDRPPKEINDLEERLRTRFLWGMTTDIGLPEYETRINIIMKKLEGSSAQISQDIVCYLAEKVNTNIRELEGALLKVLMYTQLTHKEATLDVAKEALKEHTKDTVEQIDSDKIISTVSDYFHVPSSDIIGKKKNKEIVEARMVAVYLICEMLNLPLVTIGQIFGGRDHTTIMYSRDKISNMIASDKDMKTTIEDIKNSLKCR